MRLGLIPAVILCVVWGVMILVKALRAGAAGGNYVLAFWDGGLAFRGKTVSAGVMKVVGVGMIAAGAGAWVWAYVL